MRRLRMRIGPILCAALVSLAPAWVAAEVSATEAHFPDDPIDDADFDPEGDCYACHTLDAAEGTPGTSLILKSARTMPAILRQGPAPERLGCTFCHSSLTSAREMQEVLTHFGQRLSRHPVGRRISDGAETDGEYFSTVGSDAADEIDCVDCHDPALISPDLEALGSYVGHIDQTARGNNPFMLRGGPFAAVGAYDDLCRICHGRGRAFAVGSHDDGAADGPLVEDDGTRLRTTPAENPESDKAQCTKCHDAHYSDKVSLFNDGHEGDLAVDGGNCTVLCHFPGDPDLSYDRHGHNKGQSTYRYRRGEVNFTEGTPVQLTMPCTVCHAALDTDNPTTRARHVRGEQGAGRQERYLTRFNLDKQPIDAGDGGSIYGNPLRGTCTTTCHQTREEHAVGVAGAPDVGCLDCHDEHAEGSGSNAFMIPQVSKKNGVYNPSVAGYRAKAAAEPVSYDAARTRFDEGGEANARIDFYNGANTGFCDNGECHARWGANLDDLMTPGGRFKHSGGDIDKSDFPSVDCGDCHRHSGDVLGGWRAKSYCDDCHLANGRGHVGPTKSRATHDRHVASPYVAGCADCHAHDGADVPPGTDGHGEGGVVNFGGDGAKMTEAFDYAEIFDAEAGCNTPDNGCHDSSGGAGRWKAGKLGSCGDCHAADAGKLLARPPTSGLHVVTSITRHDGELGSRSCVNCHAPVPSGAHLNGTHDSAATADFAFQSGVVSYSRAGGCRAAADCHGGADGGAWRRRWIGVVDAVPGTPGNDTPGQAVCQNCHGDATGWRWDMGSDAAADHADPVPGGAGDRQVDAACRDCHGWGGASYDRGWRTGDHGNGTVDRD